MASSHEKALKHRAVPKEGRVVGKSSKSDKFKIVRKPGYRYSLEVNK